MGETVMALKRDLEEVYRTKSFMIFVDEQLHESNGYLRSLPLLVKLYNIRRVVVWEPGRNCNKPLNISGFPIQFIHPSNFSPTANGLACVFANDERDEMYIYVDKYVEFEVPSVFVLNHASFTPKAWKLSAKPLESKCPFVPRHFLVELNKYLESTGLTDFQLRETRNLAFTEACYLHNSITSERAKNLTDLFDFDDKRLAISPIWDWAINLLSLKEENRVANVYAFVFNAFRPHIERNKHVEKTASTFNSFLKRCRYDPEYLNRIRKTNLKTMTHESLLLLKETKEERLRSILKVQLERLGCL